MLCPYRNKVDKNQLLITINSEKGSRKIIINEPFFKVVFDAQSDFSLWNFFLNKTILYSKVVSKYFLLLDFFENST